MRIYISFEPNFYGASMRKNFEEGGVRAGWYEMECLHSCFCFFITFHSNWTNWTNFCYLTILFDQAIVHCHNLPESTLLHQKLRNGSFKFSIAWFFNFSFIFPFDSSKSLTVLHVVLFLILEYLISTSGSEEADVI